MGPRVRSLRHFEGIALSHRTVSQTPRFVHSSSRRHVSAAPTSPTSSSHLLSNSPPTRSPPTPSRLARLPTSSVLRSYLITGMSSSPALLSLCFTVLRRMLDSKSFLMSIERNPVLAKLLKSTFYAQFCAGETSKEVKVNTTAARDVLGYDGIILEYALEVLGGGTSQITEEETAKEIEVWRKGMLESVEVAREGDFIGLKWSGLGRRALQLLKSQEDATPAMWSAILAACDAAAAKNVALLPGAEEESTNPGLDKWTLALQKKYNTPESGHAIIYSTYQCYLKSTPIKLAQHLAQAEREGYIAGVKLVRGAYLASEPRQLIWNTKEETDACYDACAEAVLRRHWTSSILPPPPPSHSTSASTPTSTSAFPNVNIVLATHNHASVQRAQAIRSSQLLSSSAESLPRLTYAQLQGMADEISQELVQAADKKADVQAKVVKCMTWGTTTECLNFLLRRASENKEAALRTEDTRRAMGKELWRRVKGAFGVI
ncbi:FAD-linked oxidoreductase [Lindgomyces ingoldianus]|uniref:FAD-linked oxidoreductase n=1 Tax=Lindgomyces ingoldianus TaxID=673940 RepID=A0ACB6QEI7_9PLEO|nr:FAD-linked oxidoreductase [Lindgomyces ingoldianus]KAF2465331.1 FAD-linked oxidoreductase [Lindgomyces ingoldianus]